MGILETSLSGILASGVRSAASANNIANAQSTRSSNGKGAYVPEEVASQETANGGVSTSIQGRIPASRPSFNPDDAGADQNGFEDNPNVDLGDEAATQSLTTYNFRANVSVLRTQEKMQQNLIDIYV